MILYYSTKFNFIVINSFRVRGSGHSPPPPRRRATFKNPTSNRVDCQNADTAEKLDFAHTLHAVLIDLSAKLNKNLFVFFLIETVAIRSETRNY